MKLLAAQIRIPPTPDAPARRAHLARLAKALDLQLEKAPADLVLLPELSAIDYSRQAFDALDQLAEPLDGPSFETFSELARHHGTTIAYGIARQPDTPGARPVIAHVAIGPDGARIGHYDKLHSAQFGASMEKEYFDRGNHLLVFEVAGIRVAPIICYDHRFPELVRRLTIDQGVDVILHPVAFARDGTFESWHRFARVRAMENQVYWLSLNRAGPDYGQSIFCPPWMDQSTPPTVFGDDEEFRLFEIEPDAIKRARDAYPYREDRLDDYAALPVMSGNKS